MLGIEKIPVAGFIFRELPMRVLKALHLVSGSIGAVCVRDGGWHRQQRKMHSEQACGEPAQKQAMGNRNWGLQQYQSGEHQDETCQCQNMECGTPRQCRLN